MDPDEYSFMAIRRALERWWSVCAAASRDDAALILYLDIRRALDALPSGLRQRVWAVLIMDGQARMAGVYVNDLIKGPVRRMQRFLNGQVKPRWTPARYTADELAEIRARLRDRRVA